MEAMTKLKWIKAMKSGDYKKGTTFLRSLDNCYCPFGILEEIVGAEWVKSDTMAAYGLRTMVYKGKETVVIGYTFCVPRISTKNKFKLDTYQVGKIMELADTNDNFEPVIKFVETL